MQPNLIRNSALGLGLLAGILFVGCGGAKPGASPAPTPTPTPTPAPKVSYAFPALTNDTEILNLSPEGYLIAKLDKDLPLTSLNPFGVGVDGSFVSGPYRYARLHPTGSPKEAMVRLQTLKGVYFVEPDIKVELDAGITFDKPDPLVASGMYSMDLTEAKKAWTTFGFGPNTPYVADVDTGINWSHEDLTKADATSSVAHAYSWWDLKTKAFVIRGEYDDIDPIDYVGTDIPSTDDNGHGSHTAGTIVAQGNNGKGVAGVCWQSKLISYKGFNPTGVAGNSTWAIYGSLHHLVKLKKAENITQTIPVNMSLGSPAPSYFALDMIQEGLENNIVVISSMGNEGQAIARYPAAYTGVITVGATNGRDQKVHFSSMGPHISVSAPGLSILSLDPEYNDGYVSMSGTSMATPFVTGLVTYMLTFKPDLTPAQIRAYLEKNADDIDAPGFDINTGYGRVNVFKTIQALTNDIKNGTSVSLPTVNTPLRVNVVNEYQGAAFTFYNQKVYLYEANADNTIKNYVACAVTSRNGNENLATFNLVRPATYLFTTLLGDTALAAGLKVDAGATNLPTQTLLRKAPFILAETIPDAGTSATTDVILTIYDGTTGAVIQTANSGKVSELLQAFMQSGRTIILGVKAASASALGEYALWLGSDQYTQATAPGSFSSPTNLGSQKQDKAGPQPIVLNTIYNGKLTSATAEDFYTITLP